MTDARIFSADSALVLEALKAASPESNVAVSKALRESKSLKTLTAAEISGTRDAQGFTLRQRLLLQRLRHESEPETYKMGKNFYAQLADEFRDTSTGVGSLASNATSADIDAGLMQAMVAYKKSSTRTPMMTWLEGATALNEAECAGVLAFASEVSACASPQNTAVAEALLSHFRRLGFDKEHAKLFQEIKPWVSNVLSWLLQKFKSVTKGDEAKFVQHRSDELGLLWSPSQLSTFCQHLEDKKWHEHPELLLASQNFCVGRRLFGSAISSVLDGQINKVCAAKFGEWKAAGDFTKASFDELKRAAIAEISAIRGMDKLPERRKPLFSYRGIKMEIKITGLALHVELLLMSYVKEEAVADGSLQPFFVENQLAQYSRPASKAARFQELTRGAGMVRAALEGELRGLDAQTGASINVHLAKRQAAVLANDRTFRLEIGFYTAIAGTAGPDLIRGQVLEALPNENVERKAAMVVTALDVIKWGSLAEFAGADTVDEVQLVQNMVASIAESLPIEFPRNPGPFVVKCVERLQYFYACKSDNKTPCGRAAVVATFETLQAKKTPKSVEFKRLTSFVYLLDTDGQKRFAELESATLKQERAAAGAKDADTLDMVVSGSQHAKSSSAAPSGGKKRKSGATPTTANEVDAAVGMFRMRKFSSASASA